MLAVTMQVCITINLSKEIDGGPVTMQVCMSINLSIKIDVWGLVHDPIL